LCSELCKKGGKATILLLTRPLSGRGKRKRERERGAQGPLPKETLNIPHVLWRENVLNIFSRLFEDSDKKRGEKFNKMERKV
jgi:hypothetical protein